MKGNEASKKKKKKIIYRIIWPK